MKRKVLLAATLIICGIVFATVYKTTSEKNQTESNQSESNHSKSIQTEANQSESNQTQSLQTEETESETPSLESLTQKYYKPQELRDMDLISEASKWSWSRSQQSEHFIVFWEEGFGSDPNSTSLPETMRVDIEDLLLKAEQYYKTNVETLKFAKVQGESWLDSYKMQIYLLYQNEWLATGAGYDNVIGALWVNPSTCQPVGAVIAHEIGHCFQYQIYCDQIKNGALDAFNHGFRYGYVGSNGGNTFWEQCAQWQAYQDYPQEAFTDDDMPIWFANCHRAFEHEWMRYQSYWLLYNIAELRGVEAISQIWKESQYPEDAIATYLRLYLDGNMLDLNKEMYQYAAKMATFDISQVREYAKPWIGQYETKFFSTEDNYQQISYEDCPGIYGFNVIELEIPANGEREITVDFVGLSQGETLAIEDPGSYMIDEKIAGTTTTYNPGEVLTKEWYYEDMNLGWRYGFVALDKDGARIYGEMKSDNQGSVNFQVPISTEKLFFVVMGAPEEYVSHPWNDDETDDLQFPYKIRFENTAIIETK